MRTIRLNNGTKRNSVPGQLVRVDPKNKRNFIPVDINSLEVIGTVSESQAPGKPTKIDLVNNFLSVRTSGSIGPAGPAGPAGNDGEDGLSVELQKTDTHLQWRFEGGEWADLVALVDLKGDDGSDATVTKEAVEAVLTGEIETHTHPGGSGGLTQQQIEGLI